MDVRIANFLARLKSEWRSNPNHWQKFHQFLQSRHSAGQPKPPPPLILAASAESPAVKHRRIGEQLQWAAENDCLEEAMAILINIPAEEWESSTESLWFKDNYPTW